MSHTRPPFGLIALAVIVGLAAACAGGKSNQYCQAAAECDEEYEVFAILGEDIPVDGVGNSDDSVQVCAAEVDSFVAALRVNEEEVCQDLANAYEEFMDCAIMDGSCDAWDVNDNACDNERDEINDLWQDAGNRCDE